MAKYNFRPTNREQGFLMPPDMKEWIPEGDLVWFVIDAVKQIDLGSFYRKYRQDGKGNTAYEPSMMVTLLIYAYCMGVRSSRKIERLCQMDVGFRVIAGNQGPDHSTVCRFRQKNRKQIGELFTQILRLCAEAGLVKLGLVALDGVKIKAQAALSSNRGLSSIEKEVEKILLEAEQVDTDEDELYGKDNRGDELPEELRKRASRLERLQEAKERLERKQEEEARRQAEKLREREEEEQKSGKKKRGRKPKSPEEAVNQETKANITDPESRIMKKGSGYLQAYNSQVVVTKEQIIIAADVTQEENDKKQLDPMVEQTKEELEKAGVEEEIGTLLADAGYWSEKNIQEADPDGPELLIATAKDRKQQKAFQEMGAPRGRIPAGISIRERMERKLRTKKAKEKYKQRGWMVEGVIGQITDTRGCDQFMLRRTKAVRSEWRLMTGAHNILKLWRSGKAKWVVEAA